MTIKDMAAFIAAVGLGAGGLFGYGKLTEKVDGHETRLSGVEKKVDDIWHAVDRMEGALGTKPK